MFKTIKSFQLNTFGITLVENKNTGEYTVIQVIGEETITGKPLKDLYTALCVFDNSMRDKVGM